MRTLFWCSRTGAVSGRRLYNYLRAHKPRGERLVFRCRDPPPHRRIDNIINFGRRDAPLSHGNMLVINGSLPTDKFDELERLMPHGVDDDKIITPKFSRNLSEVTFPLLIRTDNHTRGNGLWFCGDESMLPNLDMSNKYYIHYINKDAEYRVHCVSVKGQRTSGEATHDVVVLRRQRRVHRRSDFHSIKWNQEYGWGLCPVETAPPVVVGAAMRAIRRLGYDFGAVDVMLKGNKAYVIEVNSAPGLNDNTLSLYGDYLLRRLYDRL